MKRIVFLLMAVAVLAGVPRAADRAKLYHQDTGAAAGE